MSTFEERLDQTGRIINDKSLAMTTWEKYRFVYNWLRYEAALIRLNKAEKRAQKYEDRLNEDIAVFNLRVNLKEL